MSVTSLTHIWKEEELTRIVITNRRGPIVGQRWVFTPFTTASAVQIFQCFYIMKVHAQREQSAGHLVSSYAMCGQDSSLGVPLTCGITLPSRADADRQTGPSTMRASISGYVFTVGIALQTAAKSLNLILGLSSQAVQSRGGERWTGEQFVIFN